MASRGDLSVGPNCSSPYSFPQRKLPFSDIPASLQAAGKLLPCLTAASIFDNLATTCPWVDVFLDIVRSYSLIQMIFHQPGLNTTNQARCCLLQPFFRLISLGVKATALAIWRASVMAHPPRFGGRYLSGKSGTSAETMLDRLHLAKIRSWGRELPVTALHAQENAATTASSSYDSLKNSSFSLLDIRFKWASAMEAVERSGYARLARIRNGGLARV